MSLWCRMAVAGTGSGSDDEEAVFDIGQAASSSDDDDDDDDDSSDDDQRFALSKLKSGKGKLAKAGAASEDEEEGDDDDDNDDDAGEDESELDEKFGWGKGRGVFYNADTAVRRDSNIWFPCRVWRGGRAPSARSGSAAASPASSLRVCPLVSCAVQPTGGG